MRLVIKTTLHAVFVAPCILLGVVLVTIGGSQWAAAAETIALPHPNETGALAYPGASGQSTADGPGESVQPEAAPAPTPPSPDCFILGSRSFSIPFTVDANGTQPVEVRLFVSRGPSDNWKLLDRKSPDVAEQQFQFKASEDGEYWFATRTIDTRGDQHPSGAIQSQLKVYVDTTKPSVTLEADADASGRVDATLHIDDATPLKYRELRYVTDNVNQWRSVNLDQLTPDGKLQFMPTDAWKQLSIQFVATDTPGNQSVVSQLIKRPRLALAPDRRFAAATPGEAIEASALPYRISPALRFDARVVSSPVVKLDRNKPKQPSNIATAYGYAGNGNAGPTGLDGYRSTAIPARCQPQTAPAQPTPITPPYQVPSRVPGIAQRGVGMSQVAAPSQAPALSQVPAPSQTPAPLPVTTPPRQLPPRQPAPKASRSQGGFGQFFRAPGAYPSGQTLTQKVLPAPKATEDEVQLSSPQQQATAEDIPAPPPEPVGARSPSEAMRPLSSSPNSSSQAKQTERVPAPTGKIDKATAPQVSRRATSVESPFAASGAPVRYSDSERFSLEYELEAVGSQGVDAIELYGSMDGGKSWKQWGQDPDRISPFDIETKEQGVFGFRIVVVGHNGLTSPRPLSGETADIVVVVDKTAPRVRISGARYGEGDRIGTLVIEYECEDENLMPRPISLSFSDSIQGPWTTIAAGLRNDGDYVWPADPQLPRKLYLRIDATDRAGNVGKYVLEQPIDAQGLAPRARIRGFQSLSGAEQPAPGEQTAARPKGLFN